MRELKFRVWNGHSMEYNVTVGKFGNFYVNPENGNGLNPKDSASLTTCTTKYHEGTPVMQFSGTKDNFKKEVFEGDVVQYDTEDGKCIAEVIFKEETVESLWISGFTHRVLRVEDWGKDEDANYKVIGNIYQNPNLLK